MVGRDRVAEQAHDACAAHTGGHGCGHHREALEERRLGDVGALGPGVDIALAAFDALPEFARRALDLVRTRMAEEFPRKFRESSTDTTITNRVEGSASARGNNSSSTNLSQIERTMPAEDLRLMKMYIKEGWTTKEKFLASYNAR